MRGNLSTLKTVTCPYFALRAERTSSKPSTAHGPAEVQTTFVSNPKIPSTESPCGFTNRCERR